MTTARHARGARQLRPGRGLAPGAAVLGSQFGLRADGAPWWAICLLGTLGFAAVCLQIVFPQDSPDKVTWWSERWRRAGLTSPGRDVRSPELNR
jgi:hypothetical protein